MTRITEVDYRRGLNVIILKTEHLYVCSDVQNRR
jgi:hypothetical protein